MIVAGLGCRSGATLGDLKDALDQMGRKVDALVTLDKKADGPVSDLAKSLAVPLITVTEDQISGVETATQSQRINMRFATGSVAEAAALAALGPNARLIVPRQIAKSGKATAALAEGVRL